MFMVLALATDGMLLSVALLPPLLQALSTLVEAAATPVAIRKFLREKDMLSLPIRVNSEGRDQPDVIEPGRVKPGELDC
jgi:hypothetical protein